MELITFSLLICSNLKEEGGDTKAFRTATCLSPSVQCTTYLFKSCTLNQTNNQQLQAPKRYSIFCLPKKKKKKKKKRETSRKCIKTNDHTSCFAAAWSKLPGHPRFFTIAWTSVPDMIIETWNKSNESLSTCSSRKTRVLCHWEHWKYTKCCPPKEADLWWAGHPPMDRRVCECLAWVTTNLNESKNEPTLCF